MSTFPLIHFHLQTQHLFFVLNCLVKEQQKNPTIHTVFQPRYGRDGLGLPQTMYLTISEEWGGGMGDLWREWDEGREWELG